MKKAIDFLSFAENVSKTICKNISKKSSGKYSKKILDHAKESATDTLKTASKRVISKTAAATDYLICNKVSEKTIKLWKTSPQNSSKTVGSVKQKT